MEILMNFVNELGQPKLIKLAFFDGVEFFRMTEGDSLWLKIKMSQSKPNTIPRGRQLKIWSNFL